MMIFRIVCYLFLLPAILLADNSTVKPSIYADVSSFKAGEPFRIAVKAEIEGDWHIYWRYPGEFGLPTRFKVAPLENVQVKEFKFPIPETFKQTNDALGYGYSKEVVFVADVLPGENLKQDIELNLQVDWLACGESICVPGKKKLSLKIPHADSAVRQNEKMFQEALALVPSPIKEAEDVVTVKEIKRDKEGVVNLGFDWAKDPGVIELFFDLPKEVLLKKQLIEAEGLTSKVFLEFNKYKAEPIYSLLVARVDGKLGAYEFLIKP